MEDHSPSSPSISEKIDHVINFDFGDSPKWHSIRTVLCLISNYPGRVWSQSEVSSESGISLAQAKKALKRLVSLTELYADQYGFSVCIDRTGRYPRYFFTNGCDVDFERKRRLSLGINGPTSLPITDRIRRRARLLVGHELYDGVPDNYESLLHNSYLLRREDPEWEYLQDLIKARREGKLVRVEVLRAKHDIADDDIRLGSGYNLSRATIDRALIEGFFFTSMEENYHGIFFLDPHAREESVCREFSDQQCEVTCLDNVIPFSLDDLRLRIRLVGLESISEPYRRVIRRISKAQAAGKPLKTSDFKFSRGQFLHLMKHTRLHRFKFGFYIRARSDNTLQVVLIDQKAHLDE